MPRQAKLFPILCPVRDCVFRSWDPEVGTEGVFGQVVLYKVLAGC